MMEHDERPWGSYTVLAEGAGYKVKRITVQVGKRLSYQRHARREEHWLVVGGAGRATIDGDEFDVVSGTAVDVPVDAGHRIANTGTAEPLVLIEVSAAITSARTTSSASKTISVESAAPSECLDPDPDG
jgi:mannose-6-phosphate isomerase